MRPPYAVIHVHIAHIEYCTYVNMHIVRNRTAYIFTFMNEFAFITITAITTIMYFVDLLW